ncbi:MAG: tail fiber domain-containing protein, partial [Candidatus Margulisiibacteriota bacterium]
RVAGGSAAVDTAQSWTTASDLRLKKDIVSLGGTLAKVDRLRGIRFHALEEKASDPVHIGFVAQELEKEFPEVVLTDDKGYKSVAYDKLTPILLEAIKELKAEIEVLKKK